MSQGRLNLSLDRICLSIYSFGYGAGFITDDRQPGRDAPISLERVCSLAAEHGLGGVELPIDHFAPRGTREEIEALIDVVTGRDLQVRLDMETFSAEYLRSLIPVVAARDLGFVRVKVSDFYGGNRHRHPEFERDFSRLCAGIDELMPLLESCGVRLLIENHQDIMLADYECLWTRFGRRWLGVNWDIGNSLPACETPIGFLEGTRDLIGNVHLKDYRIFRADTGYRLSRCALGEGVIDFPAILGSLLAQAPQTPLTIELGALNARTADIDLEEYWRVVPGKTTADIEAFRRFIDDRTSPDGDWRTVWERREPSETIVATELRELSESVAYLMRI